MGETKEGEGCRVDRRSAFPMQQVAVEAQQRRLFGRDVQSEGRQQLFHFLTKTHRIRVVLERRYKVVREARQLRVASAGFLEPPLEPQVQNVVQVDIRKHGAEHASHNVAKTRRSGLTAKGVRRHAEHGVHLSVVDFDTADQCADDFAAGQLVGGFEPVLHLSGEVLQAAAMVAGGELLTPTHE